MENNKEFNPARNNGNLSINQQEHTPEDHGETTVTFGLTKREWLTGMALQGLCINNAWTDEQIAIKAVNIANQVLNRLAFMQY